MTGVVVDASVALTLVVSEAGSGSVRDQLRAWRRAGVDLHVPAHFWLEVGNSLMRRRRVPGEMALAVIHRLDDLDLLSAPLDRPLVLLALGLAERHGLSMYDAAYLALAEALDGRLYSADRSLLAAAGSRGIAAGVEDHRLSEESAPYSELSRPTWPNYREASAYLARLRAEARERVHT